MPPRKHLVIVESPTKARTIERFLGSDYDVLASVGHIRDLPSWGLGVDVRNGFAPRYEVPKEKRDVVKKLKGAAEKADAVYLATDPDREGEAISWHLYEAIGLENMKKPVRRVVFHEITPEAIAQAFGHTRDIDRQLVDAQQARRILDRLIGYKMSPLVSRKIRRGRLSAGRVQSVAVRMVVEREREIEAFVPVEYWTIDTVLRRHGSRAKKDSLTASLIAEFGSTDKLPIPSQAIAAALVARLEGARYTVADVRLREERRHPAPPFTTSTLQQEAGRKLGFSAARTMRAAQQLYEGIALGQEGQVGLITYMRTDSTNVAASAQHEALAFIRERYGAAFAPRQPRAYRRRQKGAQEAHEAIRPTSVRRTPESVKAHLTADQARLYELIWKRFVASQMASAILDTVAIDVRADCVSGNGAREPAAYLLRATGSKIKFAGFRVVYLEGRDDEAAEEGEKALPDVTAGELLDLVPPIKSEQHFTQPPPRYTEASLIKALEEAGVGRPSTYAPTMQTIQERQYVEKVDGRRLKPTELGIQVNDLLVQHFPDIVDVGFTAEMEVELDQIASGEEQMVPVLAEFYGPFTHALEAADQAIPRAEPEPTGELCEKCGRPMVWRYSKYGRFAGCSGFPRCRNARSEVVSTNVACPKCHQGTLIERRATRGRRRGVFYGCDRYPDCAYIVNERPLPEPCKLCGGMVVAAARGLKCTQCGNVITVEQAEREPVPAAAGH